MSVRKEIGSAVWLLALLVRFAPVEWTGNDTAWLANGNVVSDAELAELLEVSRATVANWRSRLRKLGLIGWLVAPGQGRALWIGAVNRVFAGELGGENPLGQDHTNHPTALPIGRAILRAIQERSISLTGKVVEDLSPEEGSRLANAILGAEKHG